MIKNFLTSIYASAIVGCALIFGQGCGAAPEQDEASDIGQAEEPIVIGTGGYGVSTSSLQGRCAQPGVSGQVCFSWAPVGVTNYCFSGFNAADQANITSGIEAVDGQTGLAFNNVGTFPCDMSIQQGAVANGTTNCGGSRCIEGLVKISFTGTHTALTSPAGAGHVNGTWTSYNKTVSVVDIAQNALLETPGLHTAEMFRFGQHIAALHMGLGSQDSTATRSFGTDRATFTLGASWTNAGLSAGEVCRVNGMSLGVPTQITAPFGCATN